MQESFRDKQVEWTKEHCHDVAAGDVGSKDWGGDFTRQEIDNNIATELINGMHPYPSLRQYFNLDGFVYNDSTVFNMWGGKKTGYRRVEQLRKFLRFAPPAWQRAHKDGDMFADVRPMTDILRERCEDAFEIGENVSLDEFDISTQCKFQGKETIKYKAAGDGILGDGLCGSTTGALFTFTFRKDPVEKLRRDNPEIAAAAPELSPLHLRCLGLFSRLCVRGKWRTAWMDNLFPSLRFAWYTHKMFQVHITGLSRHNRGFPLCAWQSVIKNLRLAAAAKGTVKSASLMCGSFGIMAISIYDNKPVHVFSTSHKDPGFVDKERKWFQNGRCTMRKYQRLIIVDLYNILMGGVDLLDRFSWYYKCDGKHVWHASKWTISVYRWIINTCVVQGYISYLMLVRFEIAEFMVEFNVWYDRQQRLRSSGARLAIADDAPTGAAAAAVVTATATDAADTTVVTTTSVTDRAAKRREVKRRREALLRYERMRNKKKPRPMSHIQFRVSVIRSLGFRVPTIEDTPRGRGRPQNAASVPGRVFAKRNNATVTVAYGANHSKRKRVTAVARQMPTVRLHGGKRQYDIFSVKSLERFKGGHTIPGIHPLRTVPKGNKFRCQICRTVGSKGHYGPNKNLKNPRWAKFTCVNPSCGGISLCSAECYNIWHFHPDVHPPPDL